MEKKREREEEEDDEKLQVSGLGFRIESRERIAKPLKNVKVFPRAIFVPFLAFFCFEFQNGFVHILR